MTGDAENRSKKQPVRIALAVLQPQGNGTDDFFLSLLQSNESMIVNKDISIK